MTSDVHNGLKYFGKVRVRKSNTVHENLKKMKLTFL